jgi:hypothetical protein
MAVFLEDPVAKTTTDAVRDTKPARDLSSRNVVIRHIPVPDVVIKAEIQLFTDIRCFSGNLLVAHVIALTTCGAQQYLGIVHKGIGPNATRHVLVRGGLLPTFLQQSNRIFGTVLSWGVWFSVPAAHFEPSNRFHEVRVGASLFLGTINDGVIGDANIFSQDL